MENTSEGNIRFALHFRAAGGVFAGTETGQLSAGLRKRIREKYNLPRRCSDFLTGTLAAVDDLLQRFPGTVFSPRTALLAASSLGPQDMIYGFQNELMDFPEDQVMAGLFSQSVHNAPAGGLALALDLRGPTYSVTGTDRLFFESVRLAYSLLHDGLCESVLLITGEDRSPVSDALRAYGCPIPYERFCAFFLTLSGPEGPFFLQEEFMDPAVLLRKILPEEEVTSCRIS